MRWNQFSNKHNMSQIFMNLSTYRVSWKKCYYFEKQQKFLLRSNQFILVINLCQYVSPHAPKIFVALVKNDFSKIPLELCDNLHSNCGVSGLAVLSLFRVSRACSQPCSVSFRVSWSLSIPWHSANSSLSHSLSVQLLSVAARLLCEGISDLQ